jgi:small multidrug resistance pump
VSGTAGRHARSALIFLIAAIVAALLAMPVLRALGVVQWPVFVIAWLVNLGAAWHLAQWARQQGRPAGAFGVVAALGTATAIVVYVLLAVLGPKTAAHTPGP